MDFDTDKYFSEIEMIRKESQRIDSLVSQYQKNLPEIRPLWDVSDKSISYNDIGISIVESGITIYEAAFCDVWKGIHKPSIYAGSTLWDSSLHDSRKIAKVIEAWEHKKELSPIFLVQHMTKDIGLVLDGKHRLTVSHYLGCETLPFMVETDKSGWVESAIPSAIKI